MSPGLIDELCAAGLLEDIDRAFAGLIADFDGRGLPQVALAAALASARCRAGHAYLDLRRCAGRTVGAALGESVEEGDRPTPDFATWRELLEESPAVASPAVTEPRPLVLDRRGRLYLARFRNAERRVSERLLALAKPLPGAGAPGLVDDLFPAGDEAPCRAARTALERRLCVVTGGPGTGKTTLAARLIALLVGAGLAAPDRVGLAAPTGKAAARLQESVGGQVAAMASLVPALADYRARASTLHRLLSRLRWGGASRTRVLTLDVLVVDEASMVDLGLMARLLEALPEGARLIVLGDADQLASVQPGAVLGDLCRAARSEDAPLHPCVVTLKKSYRFDAAGGIGRLAGAIVAGDGRETLAALQDARETGTDLRQLRDGDSFARMAARYAAEVVEPGLRDLRARGPAARPFPAARVLCAHRTGPFGAERFNRLVEERLRGRGIVNRSEPFYAGRPIIVRRNDPVTGLSNGDTGVVLRRDGTTRVWFPELGTAGDREVDRFEVAPSRLPEHESFFALTVHRAQGSEYDEVAFVPGPADSAVLTRELFYTAVTRARHRVTVHGDAAAVRAAVTRATERATGLEIDG